MSEFVGDIDFKTIKFSSNLSFIGDLIEWDDVKVRMR